MVDKSPPARPSPKLPEETEERKVRKTPSVAVLILTYGSPETLQLVLDRVNQQTLSPADILVVDNAGDPPAALVVQNAGRDIELLVADTNDGPAGGWYLALSWFLERCSAEWAWLLDDDVIPQSNALQELFDCATAEEAKVVRPLVRDVDSGTVRSYPSWCGPLIGREVVTRCGLPMRELVWWAEDTEYFQVRLAAKGYGGVVLHDVVLEHRGWRRQQRKPPARIYYELRNAVWMKLHMKPSVGRPIRFRKLLRTLLVGFRDAARARPLHSGSAALMLGVWDGLRGELGRRFLLKEGALQRGSGA